MTSPRAYWLCQFLGWSAYWGVIAAAYVANGQPAARMFPWAAAMVGVDVGLTHGLRALVRRRGWQERGAGGLLWRGLLASGTLAALTLGISTVVILGVQGVERDRLTLLGTVVIWVQLVIVFIVWQALYFVVGAFRRSRRAELDRVAATSAAQAAELKALKTQLNPHFLFNSLNTLRALISENPARAQEAVTRLASVLRYALGAGDAHTVPLERELEVVRDYLALEQMRLEERLTSSIDVAPECLPLMVPVMLIQTLVENAVKHGVARRTQGGTVRVAARRDNGALLLEVHNSKGTDASSAPPSTGVGLANARDRLRLLFGETASLQLDTAGPEVFARVRIPV